jgi:hypothetical protein
VQRPPTAWLLRRIALGLPLVVLPACAPPPPPGDCPSDHQIVLIDPATQRPYDYVPSAHPPDAGLPRDPDCRALCQAFAEPDCSSCLVCPTLLQTCTEASVDGGVLVSCEWIGSCGGACGRRPDGLVASRARRANDVGAWLARAAHLEAASVLAFSDLAEELALHGAPPSIVRWALEAADEERAHARMTASLAMREGVVPERPTRTPREPRALFAIALDNATEGLVHETYGAFLAQHQAALTRDGAIGRAFDRISRDEARHALFSLALDAWARTKLPPSRRRALAAAQGEAHAALVVSLDASREPFADALGLPDAERAMDLAALLA